jgi:hypothetical protein
MPGSDHFVFVNAQFGGQVHGYGRAATPVVRIGFPKSFDALGIVPGLKRQLDGPVGAQPHPALGQRKNFTG